MPDPRGTAAKIGWEEWSALVQAIPPAAWNAQRWFGGKGRRITTQLLRDFVVLSETTPSSALALIDIHFQDADRETYFVPLIVDKANDGSSKRYDGLGRFEIDGEEVAIVDGLTDPSLCEKLLFLMRKKAVLAGRQGRFVFRPTGAFESIVGSRTVPVEPAQVLPAQQTNTLVHFDERALLKCIRRVTPSVSLDIEMSTFLTTSTDFANIPRVGGVIEYLDGQNSRWPLAVLQAYVPNQGNAWEWALEHLRRFLSSAIRQENSSEEKSKIPELDLDLFTQLRRLGERTAELHAALASDDRQPDFAPEPMSAEDWRLLKENLAEEVRNTLNLLQARRGSIAAELQADCDHILEAEPLLLNKVQSVPHSFDGMKIRIHGDYHLGQVLVTGHDFVIIDFEGEPMRPVEQRRAKQLALKDVAGMTRSINYASFAGLFEAASGVEEFHQDRLEGERARWEQLARAGFLQGYRNAMASTTVSLVPNSDEAFHRLLAAFELEKALYELQYELANRPDWVVIPLNGIRQLLRG